ncbi:MAG: hypothetical protein HC781_22910 [Leptolyngbyaceae cyanobacterium CSU_1_4]|nr:hypothetical protein [Leptolyngbyaceae cyanobacterium CSU_1_4]
MKWIETRTKAGDISFDHSGVALTIFDSWFPVSKPDDRYIVVTDNRVAAKSVYEWAIRVIGLKESEVILVCSETPEQNRLFMPDPDGCIGEGVRLVILTPTAQSGLDIQIPFTAGLGLFCGVVPGTQALQLIGRARQCGEWFVSAPRRAIDEGEGAFDEVKLQRCLSRLPEALQEVGAAIGKKSDGWAFWQREIGKIWQQFNSEAIHWLLKKYYASVETVELMARRQDFKRQVSKVKTREAEQVLSGNGEHGASLREDEKLPYYDSEVWDYKLAEETEKYPKVYAALIDAYESGDEATREDAIITTKTFLNKRQMDSLKNYIQAEEPNEDDDQALQERQAGYTNYSSSHFKKLQYQELYRSLGLVSLAKLKRGGKLNLDPNENAFNENTPRIQKLWQSFQKNSRLRNLFPIVETIQDFFKVVKSAMSYLGFQKQGGTVRVKVDQPAPNGTDRNGQQRFSNTAPKYFVGWFIRAESGTKFFCENFEMIIKAVRDR